MTVRTMDCGSTAAGPARGAQRGDACSPPFSFQTVYVGSLSYQTTEDSLRQAFDACAPVTSPRMPARAPLTVRVAGRLGEGGQGP